MDKEQAGFAQQFIMDKMGRLVRAPGPQKGGFPRVVGRVLSPGGDGSRHNEQLLGFAIRSRDSIGSNIRKQRQRRRADADTDPSLRPVFGIGWQGLRRVEQCVIGIAVRNFIDGDTLCNRRARIYPWILSIENKQLTPNQRWNHRTRNMFELFTYEHLEHVSGNGERL
ncbi:MAG: hypothetical protein O2960_30220 [Verrucomicrobia bacterium]|nr:hypothetical protein [Verrucomicrobiota bacterium]